MILACVVLGGRGDCAVLLLADLVQRLAVSPHHRRPLATVGEDDGALEQAL